VQYYYCVAYCRAVQDEMRDSARAAYVVTTPDLNTATMLLSPEAQHRGVRSSKQSINFGSIFFKYALNVGEHDVCRFTGVYFTVEALFLVVVD